MLVLLYLIHRFDVSLISHHFSSGKISGYKNKYKVMSVNIHIPFLSKCIKAGHLT